MMLDMLAAIARKDYEDRRRRQTQGIDKAKAAGAYKGRPEDTEKNHPHGDAPQGTDLGQHRGGYRGFDVNAFQAR